MKRGSSVGEVETFWQGLEIFDLLTEVVHGGPLESDEIELTEEERLCREAFGDASQETLH